MPLRVFEVDFFPPLFLPFTRKDFGNTGDTGSFFQLSWDSRDGPTWCQPAVCSHSVPSGTCLINDVLLYQTCGRSQYRKGKADNRLFCLGGCCHWM